jgi:hypothetical protein
MTGHVSVGTWARALSTPCVHEHACVRCPMLWPDPAQRARLAAISDNLMARISEAEREGWLGNAERLQASLAGAQDKLAQIDRRTEAQVVTLSPACPAVTLDRAGSCNSAHCPCLSSAGFGAPAGKLSLRYPPATTSTSDVNTRGGVSA